MRALVVYESLFGSTRTVAEGIAEGLRSRQLDVQVCSVAEADIGRLLDADLLVVGGPTHVHGMSRPQSRTAAETTPEKYAAQGQHLLAPVPDVGVREWLDGLPHLHGQAAAFDTRADAPPLLTGRASPAIARRLRKAGCTVALPPESFVVTKETGLKAGEPARAFIWGQRLADVIALQAGDHQDRRGA